MKKKRDSDRIWRITSVLLLILGLCLWFHPTAYSKEYVGGFSSAEYPFLQAGDYMLEITYVDAPENCRVIVYSPALVDEWNQQGVVFAEENLPGTDGALSIAVHLERGTESVQVLQSAGEECYIFDSIRLQSVRLQDRDNYFLGICAMLLAVFLFFFGRYLAGARVPALLLLFGAAASLPLMNDSLKWGHDIEFHLARIEGLYQGLRSGAFPVRVNPVQLEGFGYLSASMYPQLFLYPAACLRFLGVSTMLCYKLLMAGVSIATAFLAHYSVKGITKSEKAGLLAAVLYTFSTYRLVGLYTRATVGETMAMVFFPLAAWGIYEVLWGNERKWPLLALGVTGVMQCHILSTEMCVLFLALVSLLWLIVGDKKEWVRRINRCFLAAGVTILWNMGLLLPILFYSREELQVYVIKSDLSLSAAYLSQMFTFFPEPAGSNQVSGYTRGEMPISVGGILLVCGVLLVAALVRGEKGEYSSMEKAGGICLGLGGAAILLASDLFPWRQVQSIEWLDRLVTPLQFVWRFLGPASFFLCVAGAVGMIAFQERFAGTDWLVPVILAVLACSTMFYFDRVSDSLEDMPDKMLIAGIDDSGSAHYLYDESDMRDFVRESAAIQCQGGSSIVCSEYHKDGTFLSVRITPKQVKEGDKLIFPLYGYTGYQVLINGVPVNWERVNSRIACDMPVEESLVEIRYKGHWAFAAGDAVSVLSAAAAAGYLIWKNFCQERRMIMSTMRGIDTPVRQRRRRVFKEVADLAYHSENLKDDMEALPYKIVDYEESLYWESVYRDRAIIRERIRLAMGMSLRPENREHPGHLTQGLEESNIDEKYYEPPLMQVIPSACNACPEDHYEVTSACMGCVAHPCHSVCPKGAISMKDGKSVIDQEKCIKCGKCKAVCPYDAVCHKERPCKSACGVNAIKSDRFGRAYIDNDMCVSCGQCMVSCPFGAIADKSQIFQLIRAMQSGRTIIAQVAPAFVGQFGPGVTPDKFKTALKELGFADVYETALGADQGCMAEAEHYVEEVASGKQSFALTSCCPSWSVMAKNLFPETIDKISNELTPMVATARIIKQEHPEASVVFIGPCASKKLEASRRTIRSDVDFVITFEELTGMFEAKGILLDEIREMDEMQDATGAGRGYGVAGGVAEAIEECIKAYYPGTEVKIEHAEGLEECRKMLLLAKAGRKNGCLIEGMACPGGCVAGAGTNIPIAQAAKEVAKFKAAAKEAVPERHV